MMTAAAATTAVAPLGLFNSRVAAAGQCDTTSFRVAGFGPLKPTLPVNTSELADVPGARNGGDLRGIPLLSLPPDFQYRAISIRGHLMSDGNLVPGDHDGMGCFRAGRDHSVLVRNHELDIGEREAGSNLGCLTANGKRYDSFTGAGAGLGGAGTTTVVLDHIGRVVEDFVSLGGTVRNCAGGPTPWRSWISCEETFSTPAVDARTTEKHGYNFEVPSQLREAVDPIPLVAMGRMNHEAISVDGRTGYVYETEDRKDSAYYRFVPKQTPTRFGHLQRGGDLYAMVIEQKQRSNCNGRPLPTARFRGTRLVDTRGTGRGAGRSMLPFLGQRLAVRWVKLDDVDPDRDTLRYEAHAKGAAVFWRGEGAWYHGGKHYWVCRGAGDAAEGQVWCYDPRSETVSLIVESTDENLLDGPDNLTVARDRTIYICEDGSKGRKRKQNFSQRVVGVDTKGGLFDFAQNIIPGDLNEFTGACFSPNGRFMFVNNQGIGITFAIWRSNRRRILLNRG